MIEQRSFVNLLDECFPGIKANIIRCEKLGYSWSSKLFVKEENGEAVAHVGCLDYPIFIDGSERKVAALHAICTKSTHRNRGLATELIQEALEWAKKHYECVILYTAIPRFYEKYSFRYIQEYRFHLKVTHSKGTQLLTPVMSPRDDALFRNCYRERVSLSNVVWAKDDGKVSAFNALFGTYPTYWSLHYSSSLQGILSFEIKDKTLHLYDVIASRIPSLESILDHLPSEIENIFFYFSPDQLAKEAVPEPFLFDNGHLMVHGNFSVQKPFIITPLSQC